MVLMLLLAMSLSVPGAALLLWAGSLAMPWVLYRLLCRSRREQPGGMSFVEYWAEGIASFALGSLVPAAVAYLLLRYAFPDFIINQVLAMIESLKSMDTPEGDMWAGTMQTLYDKGALPGAADVAANIISFNIVVGTVLSLLVAIPMSIGRKASGRGAA